MSIFKKKVKVAAECRFPNCEECADYKELNGKHYCTVPEVISKQKLILTESLIAGMQKKIADLEDAVYREL